MTPTQTLERALKRADDARLVEPRKQYLRALLHLIDGHEIDEELTGSAMSILRKTAEDAELDMAAILSYRHLKDAIANGQIRVKKMPDEDDFERRIEQIDAKIRKAVKPLHAKKREIENQWGERMLAIQQIDSNRQMLLQLRENHGDVIAELDQHE